MNVSKSKPSILTRRMGTGSHLNLKSVWDTEKLDILSYYKSSCESFSVPLWIRGCVLVGEDPLVHQSDGWSEQEDTWPPTHFTILSNWSLSMMSRLMVADNPLQANLIWNSVFCAESQLSSKLISHPPLTWSPPKLTCNVNTEAQISQKHQYVTVLQSNWKRIHRKKIRFVKIAKRAPPFPIKLQSGASSLAKHGGA